MRAKRRAIIGVDPGQSGGIAVLPLGGSRQGLGYMMPISGTGKERGIDWRAFAEILRPWVAQVWVERVHSMPKQGVASTFKFGMNYGGIFGACGALGLQTTLVTPQKWKKEILSNFEEKDKQAAIDYATLTFPEISLIPQGRRVPQDGIADALCIAAYGLNQYQAK